MRWNRQTLIALLVIVGMVLMSFPVLAAPGALPSEEDPVEIEFTGTVTAVDATAGTLQVEVTTTEGTVVYTVNAPAGFDFTGITVGDTVEVEGILVGQGEVDATKIEVEDEEPTEIEFRGTVVAIDSGAGTLGVEVDTAEGTVTYTVHVPDGFDFLQVNVGDTVEVEGILIGEHVVDATKVEVEEEEPVEIEFTGTVVAIDLGAGTLGVEVDTDDGTVLYTVQVPAGFDFGTVSIGDTVEVEGLLIAEGLVDATKIEVEKPTPTPTATLTPTAVVTTTPTVTTTATVTGTKQGFYCRNRTVYHPVGKAIAERYGVPYDQVISWFCEGRMGFGQIMLALKTAQITGDEPGSYLERRTQGEGWGNIWHSLGLSGKGKKKGTPVPEEGDDSDVEEEEQEEESAGAVMEKNQKRDRDQDRDGNRAQQKAREKANQSKGKGSSKKGGLTLTPTPTPSWSPSGKGRSQGGGKGNGRR